jgi:DNA modification methylase
LPNKWPADRVERRPIEALIPYARNSRTHSDAQVAQIAASMKEWGWTNPVLVDETGMIIAGHGRVLAARKLGLAEVPVMVAEGWTEPQKRAYVLADNQLALNAGWDMELLSNELADLQAQGFDLGLTGFSDIDALLAGRGTAGLTDPDAVPEPGARAVATLGDVWLLGGHRLVCGDSTDAAAVGACLGQERPHLMVTDPPYGVEYDAGWRSSLDSIDRATGLVNNDNIADWKDAYALFPGDVAYVWHSGLFADVVSKGLQDCGFQMRSQIIWAKPHFAISRGHYHGQHEPCWYAVRKGSTGHWRGDRKQSTVWQIANATFQGGKQGPENAKTGHGTQKPVECMRRPMENNSVAGNAVYEPFSGSGTTIIAGEQCARRVLAIELNPIYVDVAIKRWQDFTGKKATLESTGQTFEDVADARYDWRKDGFESWEVWCAAKREELVKAGKAA